MLTVRYSWLGVRPGLRLLDFGCGGGRHAVEAMKLGAIVTAVDRDPKETAQAAGWVAAMLLEDKATAGTGGEGHVVTADGLDLPFSDGCFDLVVASEVLEHVHDDGAAMRELARALRPGGLIALTVPRCYPEALNWVLSREYHQVPGGHVRIYRRSQIRRRLRAAGLQPLCWHHAHALHTPYWWLRCAVGIGNEEAWPVKAYHRLLVWDITARPLVTRAAEALLNPLLGKSVVVYARKLG